MRSRDALREIIAAGGPARFFRLIGLSLVAAATEGLGFVLLVPLLAALGGAALPYELVLPDLSLALLLILFVALVALRAGAEVARRLALQDLRAAVVDGLRMQAITAIMRARWPWHANLAAGEAQALVISDIDRCGYAVEMCASLARLAMALAALSLAALVISPHAALAGLALGIVAFAAFTPLRRRARLLGENLSQRYDRLHSRLGETLGALRVVKSFGRETAQADEISETLGDLRRTERAYVRSAAAAQAMLQLAGAVVAALGIWLAIERFGIPLAGLLVLAALFVRALPLVAELLSSAQGWAHARPALERTLILVGSASAAAETLGKAEAPRLTQALALEGISLAHTPARPALRHVDLVLAHGEFVAVTGPSGAGKSTLADICAGLIAPDEGTLLVDGQTIDEANRIGWRERVAYVQQEPVLFSGSVRTNLRFARPEADEAKMMQALADAHAGFVAQLPGGLDCEIGDGGRALSGGERQRIALARALLRDPDLLILDEATNALDSDSEEAIAEALRGLAGRRTILAVTHRGLLCERADRVVRLEQGRVVPG